MATKKRSRRRQKKDLIDLFRDDYPLRIFDYERRLRPLLASALLRAGVTAIAFYGIGFGLGYFSWLRGMLEDTAFFKLVWILMIPATVAALLVWLLMKNRFEYPLRQEIAGRILTNEEGEAPLWCFAPVLAELAPNDSASRQLLQCLRQGRRDEVAPEEYCQLVQTIDGLLASSGERSLSLETLSEIEANLASAAGKSGRTNTST